MPETGAHLPTPGAILDYWINAASEDHLFADRQHKLWFTKSAATDAFISQHFTGIHAALHAGLAQTWARSGPRARLAAIIVLDQFSRNMFRDTPDAFVSDPLALRLAKDGVSVGDDQALTEIERSFFYLPFEHSENLPDQHDSVRLFSRLSADARPAFSPICASSDAYAQRHKEVIERFGRFPHRNTILGRENTPEEAEYLSQPGAGF